MKTIVLIEDNPDNRLLVQAMLEEQYHLVEYENGIEALQGLPNDNPDLILLDISLPEMDGVEVLRHIRKHDQLKKLPVLALTAHAMAGDRENFLNAGFDDYITKPILDEEILFNAIEKGFQKNQ